jgi:hypothetical protein
METDMHLNDGSAGSSVEQQRRGICRDNRPIKTECGKVLLKLALSASTSVEGKFGCGG